MPNASLRPPPGRVPRWTTPNVPDPLGDHSGRVGSLVRAVGVTGDLLAGIDGIAGGEGPAGERSEVGDTERSRPGGSPDGCPLREVWGFGVAGHLTGDIDGLGLAPDPPGERPQVVATKAPEATGDPSEG